MWISRLVFTCILFFFTNSAECRYLQNVHICLAQNCLQLLKKNSTTITLTHQTVPELTMEFLWSTICQCTLIVIYHFLFQEIVSPTPVLVLQCSTIKPDAISVWAEGWQVCQGISSIWYGVVLLMAVYYAHGIDYAPEAANTLGFLQRYMMSIKKEDEGPKIPTPILRLLSALIWIKFPQHNAYSIWLWLLQGYSSKAFFLTAEALSTPRNSSCTSTQYRKMGSYRKHIRRCHNARHSQEPEAEEHNDCFVVELLHEEEIPFICWSQVYLIFL